MPVDAVPRARSPNAVLQETYTLMEPGHVTELCEMLGQHHLKGQILSLGHVFPMLDLAAGRCAALCRGPHVVTGSFDDVHLLKPVRHADVVTVRAVVESTGSRSILIRVDAFRQPDLLDSHQVDPVLLIR